VPKLKKRTALLPTTQAGPLLGKRRLKQWIGEIVICGLPEPLQEIQKPAIEISRIEQSTRENGRQHIDGMVVEECALEQSAIRPLNEQQEITTFPETECGL
jgi:hypothetical protein